MNVSPSNESFTLAVHAVGGSEWGVAVTEAPGGNYNAEFCRVAMKLAPEDTVTCLDPRRIQVLGTARFGKLIELRPIIELWCTGKLALSQSRLSYPLEGEIPAFLAVVVAPGQWKWVRIADDGVLKGRVEVFEFCGPLA